MSVTEHESPYGFPESINLLQALDHCFEAQRIFLQTAELWTQRPTGLRFESFILAADLNYDAFQQVVHSVAVSEELTPREKADCIVGTFQRVDTGRARGFAKLAPAQEFEELAPDFSTLLSKLDEELAEFELEEDSPIPNACEGVVEAFGINMKLDVERLVGAVEAKPISKVFNLVRKVRRQAPEIGKLTIGAALGGVIAAQLNKENSL